MLKTYIITILLSSMFLSEGFSQQLRLRLEVGNSLNFSTYRSNFFKTFYEHPLPGPEFTYKKLTAGKLIGSKKTFNLMPDKYGFLLEYDFKKRNRFALGFMIFDLLPVSDIVIYNYLAKINGDDYILPRNISYEISYYFYKINFEYSRDFGKGLLKYSPIVGMSYSWAYDASNVKVGDTLSNYIDTEDEDLLYNNAEFTIQRLNILSSKSYILLTTGLNFRINSKKRELFALKIYYQQGFTPVISSQAIVKRNNKVFPYNSSYSYGSALYLKLSIPITIYDFGKKKWF